jgi:hypothetical protein
LAHILETPQNRMAPLDTEAGQLSAITTMTLMQMVADTYEEARIDWEKNADREMIEGVDDVWNFSLS